jgi:hypothetical protein
MGFGKDVPVQAGTSADTYVGEVALVIVQREDNMETRTDCCLWACKRA